MNAGGNGGRALDTRLLSDDALGSLLASAVTFPATPDLAPRVRAFLDREAIAARGRARAAGGTGLARRVLGIGLRSPEDHRGSRGLTPVPWLRVRRSTALALIALLIAAAVGAAVLLGVPGIGFRNVPEVPRTQVPVESLKLGTPATLAEIQAASDMTIYQPGTADGSIGAPERLLFDPRLAGGMVSSVWASTDDLPATGPEGIGVLLSQLRARLPATLLEKLLDSGVRRERVELPSGDGWWLSGATHLLVDRSDGITDIPLRLAGDTLVWYRDGYTFRLETAAGKERAMAIAASLEPIFEPAAIDLLLEPYADELEEPVFVTGDRSDTGWMYAIEQAGRIVRISPSGNVADEPFLDITERVTAGGEQGLLGLGLHPGYAENRRLFVDYTRAEDGATVVSEFRADSDASADPASERILLVIAQPYPNHNGGMIAFDADGMLLIGMGDGGGGGDPDGNGQATDRLLGKLLRIDVDGATPYAIPADNPFADGTGGLPEIWALGLRNPWRFSVDPGTGDIWIGDVGQDAQEEVDLLFAGQGGINLGWNVMEGSVCYEAKSCDATGLTPPIVSISHDTGVCSVVGGYVYHGSREPGLLGGYVFSDYCTGDLWVLSAADAVAGAEVEARIAGHHDGSVVSFGQGDDGELYVVDHGGAIYRLTAVPAGTG